MMTNTKSDAECSAACDCYAGYTIISGSEDGSLLVESPAGSRQRIWNVGTAEHAKLIERLRGLLSMQSQSGDRLGIAVAEAINRGEIGSRSKIADALLDYAEIGSPGRPGSVNQWLMMSETTVRMIPVGKGQCPKCESDEADIWEVPGDAETRQCADCLDWD